MVQSTYVASQLTLWRRRFKKDMWEKIAKEMALPWRAAEAMHWQIGEIEMASRANVPVFHLAGYSPSQPTQSYSNAANTTPLSGSGRSEESASPRSTTEGYPPMQSHPDPSREAAARMEHQMRVPERPLHRKASEEAEDSGFGRRSPMPLPSHDSITNSLGREREESAAPKQYLSPFAKGEEGNGRRSPLSGR